MRTLGGGATEAGSPWRERAESSHRHGDAWGRRRERPRAAPEKGLKASVVVAAAARLSRVRLEPARPRPVRVGGMNVRGGRGGPGAGEEGDEDEEEEDEEREGGPQALQGARLPPISGCAPEPGRRKLKKKKKKKKAPAGPGKASGKGDGSSKDPSSKLESMKEFKREKEENKHLSYSSSGNAAFSSAEVEDSLSNKINESLRWQGVLEDPVAEEERIRIYKLNRRKRYRLSTLEGFCSSPSVPEGTNEKVSNRPDSASNSNNKQPIVKVDCLSYFLDGNMTSKMLLSPELVTTNVPEQKLASALANLS